MRWQSVIYAVVLVLVAGIITWIALTPRDEDVADDPIPTVASETKYMIGLRETISQSESEQNPPNERWQVLKELQETTEINIVHYPVYYDIFDTNLLKEIVDSFTQSNYVEIKAYPKREPDMKLYFKNKDGFIMAARLFAEEGIIDSPEGPIVRVDAATVQKIMSYRMVILDRAHIGAGQLFDPDDVLLLYDGDIKLKAIDSLVTVLPDVPVDWIGSDDPFNQIVSHLNIRENQRTGLSYIVVGATYSFTNKYGSTSWLKGYEYDGSSIKEILNIDDVVHSLIIVKDYDSKKLTLEIEGWDHDLTIDLMPWEIERIEEYISFYQNEWDGGPWEFIGKDDYLFFAIMPDYLWADYDDDGTEELLANLYMRGGASGITDIVHFVYRFTESGIELIDVVSARNTGLVDLPAFITNS